MAVKPDLGTGYVQLQETLEKTRGELQRKDGLIEKARQALALGDEQWAEEHLKRALASTPQ